MKYNLCYIITIFLLSWPSALFPQEQQPHEVLIGKAFELLQKGHATQAAELGSGAVSAAEKAFGPEHEKTAETRASAAFIELRAGNASQAEALFRKAIQTRERFQATETLPLAIAICGLAQTLQSTGNTADAEPLFRKTVSLLDRAYPGGHAQTAVALEALGNILSSTGRIPEAEALVQRAVNIRETLLGRKSPLLAGSLNALSLVCRRAGRFDAAASHIRRIIELEELAAGSGSIRLAEPLLNLADCLDSCENYVEAEPAYRRAIALQETHLGSGSIELAFSLKSLAMNRLCGGSMPDAESALERAVGIFSLASDAVQLEIASIDFMLGSFAQARGLFQKAKGLYQTCLNIRKEALAADDPDIAAVLNNLADIELQLNELANAERDCREALRIREKSLGSGHRMTQITMNNLATVLVALNRNAEAEGVFTTALATLERQPAKNADTRATIINNLGELYRKIGRYTDAEEFCRKAYEMRKQLHGEDAAETASSLSSLAAALEMNGRYREAETAFKKALETKQRCLGENHPDVATLKGNLASLYESLSRFSEAESLLQSALQIRSDALGNDHPATALLLCRLGGFLFDLGRTASGIDLQERGCAILERKLGATCPDRGTALCNLGSCYARLDQADKAEQALSEGIEIASASLGAGHPNVANGLNQLSVVMQRQGRNSDAIRLLEQARDIQEKTIGPDHPDLAITLTNLGIFQMETGNDGIAQKNLERGASIFENSVGKTDLNYIGCLETLARLDDRQGRYLEGIKKHLQAIFLEETNASGNTSEQYSLIHRVRQTVPVTGFLASLAKLARQFPAQARRFEGKAFEIMESCRSRRFIEQMSRASAARVNGIPDDIQQDMRELNAGIQETGQRIRQELRKPRAGRNQELLRGLEGRYGQQLQVQQTLQEKILKEYPSCAGLIKPEKLTAETVRREILRENELLLEFWEGDDYLHAVVIGSGSERFVSHEIGSDSLRLKIREFRKALRSLADVATFKAASTALSREILLPFLSEAEIGSCSRLIIVPSAFLANIPFEALLLSDTGKEFRSLGYLFKKVPISSIPSTALLKEIRRGAASRASLQNASEPVLLFGDPVYSPEQTGSSAAFVDKIRLAPLPGTRKEVEIVSTIFYGDPAAPNARLGSEACESFIKQASADGTLARVPILHFAVHGIIPGEIQGLSEPCLALSTFGDAPEDGLLNMSEIFGLKLNARLIVLSACNTGIVDVALPNLEALSCFARAFFYAGADRLLLTLWSISDAATVDFMRSFYSHLRQTGHFLESLTEARKSMLISPAFSHPFYWAPFILIGDEPPAGSTP